MTHKILMADHSSSFRSIIKENLNDYDCDFFEADNGKNGLSLTVSKRPDLIILDVNMPIMDGEEMLNMLKSRPDLKDIPVIMVTTESEQSKVLEFAKLGIKGYFVKPLKAEDLINKAKEIIELQPKKVAPPVKDNSGKYFFLKGDVLLMKIPAKVTKRLVEELEKYLPVKLNEMANAGMLKFILDLREVALVNIHLLKITIATVNRCKAARRRFRIVADVSIDEKFKDINEMDGIEVDLSIEDAMNALGSKMPDS